MSDGSVPGGRELDAGRLFAAAESDFARYEVVKDLVDECIDLALNYRQSGHPGGSRAKVHMMLALLLSGAMRWDVLRPWRRFGDRFVLSAGHTVPLVYATLAVLNEAVWRTQTTEHWVTFKSFGFLPLTLVFALAQAPLISRYEAKPEETSDVL